MTERGIIRNEKVAQILRDFSGLRFERGITPTDIDGFVEFNDKVYVLIETKFADCKVHGGQRLALERLCDTIQASKHCILIVANHNIAPESGQIEVGGCKVSEYRTNGKWHVPEREITVRHLIDKYRNHVRETRR